MKRKILFLVCILSLISTLAQAMERPSLGGISLRSSLDYIQSIYGPADKGDVYRYKNDVTYDYSYGKDKSVFFIIVKYHKPAEQIYDGVIFMTVTKNNGFKTAEGIHVGSTLQEVLSVYGEDITLYDLSNTRIIRTSNESREYKRSVVKRFLKNPKVSGIVEIWYGEEPFVECYTISFTDGIVTEITLSGPANPD